MYCAHHIPQPESAASAGVLVVSMPESELSQSALPASPRVTVYSLGSDDESVTFSMALGDCETDRGSMSECEHESSSDESVDDEPRCFTWGGDSD